MLRSLLELCSRLVDALATLGVLAPQLLELIVQLVNLSV
jgi:hypothetical protein